MKRTIIAFILILLFCTAPSFAADPSATVTGRVLQVKLDRLYLNRGIEDHVFPGCRFLVYRGDDSIYSGCIQWSYPGVAVSYPTGGFFDNRTPDSLTIAIEPAPIDTASTITIGYAGYLPLYTPSDSLEAGYAGYNPLVVRPYQSQLELALAFEDGSIDGCYSYRLVDGASENSPATGVSPAPFFVALVPNPAREINRGGFLATSLYYRIDPGRLPVLFDGDEISPFYSLCRADLDSVRPYPYSPDAGRKLLGSLRTRSRTVSFAVEHPMLLPAARYFADVLSRDRFRTSVVHNPHEADIRLVIVPLTDSKIVNLRHLYGLLAADTVAAGPVNETIRLIDGYLRTATLTLDSSTYEHHLRLAESALRDDLGVLPLFRPTMFFAARDHLVGTVSLHTMTAELDFDLLRKVILPTRPKECRP